MNKKSCIKSKWVIKIKSILAFIMFFGIYVSVSSATVEMSNIEQGDGIWGAINVDASGLVSVNAMSSGTSDDISLYLYNQTGILVATNIGYNGQTSIDYPAPTNGIYRFKVILNLATFGGTRTISASSNKEISLMQKNIRCAFNVADGQAIYYDSSLNAGELIFMNLWSSGPYDDISLYLYNQTGMLVASNIGYNGQTSIDYVVPTIGTYTAKNVLDLATFGGTRTLCLSTNSNFTGITVLSPNGKENWTRGTTNMISWTSYGSTGANVLIELLKDGVPSIIIPTTPNDGSYNWEIPSDQVPGTDFKVRITSTSYSAYNDTSDANFTITALPSITVISPNGGEVWSTNTTQNIRWDYTENPGPNIRIELLKNEIFHSIINSSVPIGGNGSGSYNWLINSTQIPGTDYKVRITSTTNSNYTDISNNFTITKISPIVSIKTDKSKYSPGETMNVTLGIHNPTNTSLNLEWYIGVPQSDTWVTKVKASIPAGYLKTHSILIPVGNWGPSPLGLVHYVQLLDPIENEILAQNAAVFAYSPVGTSDYQVDIVEELMKQRVKITN